MTERVPYGIDPEEYEAQRRRAALAMENRTRVSLQSEARWYRERASDASLPERERRMWDQLAKGLESRLGHKPTPEEEPTLDLDLPEPTEKRRSLR